MIETLVHIKPALIALKSKSTIRSEANDSTVTCENANLSLNLVLIGRKALALGVVIIVEQIDWWKYVG